MAKEAVAISTARDADPVRDDMRQVERRNAPETVRGFLDALEQEPADRPFLTRFCLEDQRANRLQVFHNRTALVAIVAGTAALLVAIVQQAVYGIVPKGGFHDEWSRIFFWAESAMIAVAALAVLPAVLLDLPEKRLRARYGAEQLRLAKWRLVCKPELWVRGSATALAEEIRKAARAGRSNTVAGLKAEASWEDIVTLPSVPEAAAFEPGTLPGLIRHYCDNRLEAQIAYFHRTKEREHHSIFANPHLPVFFFVLSLGFVLLHLVLEAFVLYGHESRNLKIGGGAALLLAALLPALWSGIRTWRSATEVARTAMRAEAKHVALEAYRNQLREPGIAPAKAFAVFALCEGLFAQEQGEWLRLMIETEWFL